jgi:O-succinylbenzoic acid--CoA ligase
MIIRALVHGLALWYKAPQIQLSLNTREKISLCALTPLQVQSILASADGGKYFFEQVQCLLIGGAAISPALNQVLRYIPTACYESYGMTETISHIALRKINGDDAQEYFTAMPGVSLQVDDEQRLHIDAPSIGVQHLQTNDMVEWMEEGRFKYLGRKDNVINSGGLKVHPEELESQLSANISKPFAICGLPSEMYGEEVVLVIEGNLDIPALSAYENLIKNMSGPERPRKVMMLSSFPRSENGKILRKALRQMLLEQMQ